MRNRYYDSDNGRFITEDNHWNPNNMVYGDSDSEVPNVAAIIQSSNLYIYGLNNPLMYIDFSGTVAYEHFKSIEDAVKDWAWNYYGTSYYVRMETASMLYMAKDENGNTYYTYTWSTWGNPHEVDSKPARDWIYGLENQEIGTIHSHPNYIGGFSKNDKGFAQKYKLASYLVEGTLDNVSILKYSETRAGYRERKIMDNVPVARVAEERKAPLQKKFAKEWKRHIKNKSYTCSCRKHDEFPREW